MAATGDAGTGAQRLGYEALYSEFAPAAYRTALSVLGSPAAAEDVLQDACVVVFKRLEAGRSIEDARAYACKVAFRLASKEKARASRIEELVDELVVDVDHERQMAAATVAWQGLQSLSKAQRAALVLTAVQGMSGDEVGRALGVSSKSAYELVRAGKQRMLRTCVEAIGDRRDRPAECGDRARQLYAQIDRSLKPAAEHELDGHVAGCSYCRDTREQLLQARDLAALLPFFQPDRVLARKRDPQQLVAAKLSEEPRRWPQAIAIALALLIMAVLGSMPLLIHRVPLKSTAAPGAASAVAVVSTPIPTPTAAPTPPLIVPGSFVYLSGGELYYRTSAGAPAQQLTSTGGHVDFFTWAPDGRSLYYKQTSGATQVGDLRQVDLHGQHLEWSLSVGAVGMSFSPDGSSYAVAVPAIQGPTVPSYRILIGSTAAQPDPGREIDVPVQMQVGGGSAPVQSASLTEPSPLIWTVMPGGPGVRWHPSGIQLDCAIHCGYLVDPATKAMSPHVELTAFDPERAYAGPAGSQFAIGPGGVTVAGRSISVSPSAAAVVFLDVSSDGSAALATYAQSNGGHGVSLIAADGSVTQFTNDGNTALGLFQPYASG